MQLLSKLHPDHKTKPPRIFGTVRLTWHSVRFNIIEKELRKCIQHLNVEEYVYA